MSHTPARGLPWFRHAGVGPDAFGGVGVFTTEEAPPSYPPARMKRDNRTRAAAEPIQSEKDVVASAVSNLTAVLDGFWAALENAVSPEVLPRRPLHYRKAQRIHSSSQASPSNTVPPDSRQAQSR